MASPSRPPHNAPSLDEMMARFLATSTAPGAEPASEVELYEVSGGFRPAARAIWDETLVPLRSFGLTPDKLTLPPEWSAFVGEACRSTGLPMAAGLFPQQYEPVAGPQTGPSSPLRGISGLPALRTWVRKAVRSPSATALLVASGIAAAIGEQADALAALSAAEAGAPPRWTPAIENQRAAVLWLGGRQAEAAALWAQLPDGPVVAFNRGMAQLFLGQTESAQNNLRTAAATLPDLSGWSHLAWIYSSNAAMRSGSV